MSVIDAVLVERAPAKVNLSLRILARRDDGYHELESLVVFAADGDELAFVPGETLSLTVEGPTAGAAGTIDDNLVIKAARGLAERVDRLVLGRFVLAKRLPVAAGLGGGSSDAAAALRLLARANSLSLDDPRLAAVAAATGADVPVCLDPRARIMRGIGEKLSPPLPIAKLAAVLVNPGVAVATKDVFGKLGLDRSERRENAGGDPNDLASLDAVLAYMTQAGNDLEPVALSLQPAIAEVLATLKERGACRFARMTGSGATCLGLYASEIEAHAAAAVIAAARPLWWVKATTLG